MPSASAASQPGFTGTQRSVWMAEELNSGPMKTIWAPL